MKKINKILILIIIILITVLIFLLNKCFYFAKAGEKAVSDVIEMIEINKKLEEDAEFNYKTAIILETAGIEITSDDDGFFTVTDTINNTVLKTDFKVEIDENGTYKVINK